MSSQHRPSGASRRRSSNEIRSQIVATRARLAADIDAARAKLSRRGLEQQAMSALRGAQREASGALNGWSTSADQQVGRLSHLAVEAVKRYPVVTTLVGVGLALLALRNDRSSRAGSAASERRPENDVSLVGPTARADLPPPR
jgi:hypothetical protein